jgi:hypothetical protein
MSDITSFNYAFQEINATSNMTLVDADLPNYGYNITYYSRFNNIDGEFPQNSYFSPIVMMDKNKTNNILFFSGGGSVSNATCFDNFLHFIKLDRNSFFSMKSYGFKKVFSMSATECQAKVYGSNDMYESAAIYDYASVLLFDGVYHYYVIHGGCLCYMNYIKSEVIIVQIDNNLNFLSTSPLQNTAYNV